MAKLTKPQMKAHNAACEILQKDRLTEDDKEFVLRNWHEGATHMNGQAGAFFTPLDLAYDFAIETHAGRVIDLCGGIGMLSFATQQRHYLERGDLDLTIVEINPAYIEVGRKILPEATWIQASVFDVLDMDLEPFDLAISNPPFGAVKRALNKTAPRYTGKDFEFHVIDIAAHIARRGTFLVPQKSAGFKYSGSRFYERQKDGPAVQFQEKTGLEFEPNCGIDTAVYQDQWRGVSPLCEIVCIEFPELEAAEKSDQLSLFEAA